MITVIYASAAHEYAAANIMQGEVVVHSKDKIQLGTLEAWPSNQQS